MLSADMCCGNATDDVEDLMGALQTIRATRESISATNASSHSTRASHLFFSEDLLRKLLAGDGRNSVQDSGVRGAICNLLLSGKK
jgi:hypothetical protein